MDLISVVIPVFNAEKYLKRCLDSILHQTYTNLEVIIIDDGSTDNSSIIVDEYSRIDHRIKVVHKNNEGVSAARNLALNMANGSYIGFIDSDDWVDADYYQSLYDNIKKHQCDIVIGGYYVEHEDGRKIRTPNVSKIMEFNSLSGIKAILKGEIFGGHLWNKLYKASLFKGVRFHEDIHMNEDLVMNVELFLKIKKAIYIPVYKYHYFRYSESSCANLNSKYFTILDAGERITKIITSKCKDAVDSAEATVLKMNLYTILKMINSNYYNNQKIQEIKKNLKRILLNNNKNKEISFKQKMMAIMITSNFAIFKFIYFYIGRNYIRFKQIMK